MLHFYNFQMIHFTMPVKGRRECEISSRSVLQLTSVEAAVLCSVVQSCLTPYDPVDCSPPGSSVHGILQARMLEWVAIGQAAEVTRILPELLYTYTNKRLDVSIDTYIYIYIYIHTYIYVCAYIYIAKLHALLSFFILTPVIMNDLPTN